LKKSISNRKGEDSMNERDFENIISSIDVPAKPPEGLKEAILINATSHPVLPELDLSRLERLIFEKPLRAAGLVSAAVSGVLWAVLGSAFPALVSGWIG